MLTGGQGGRARASLRPIPPPSPFLLSLHPCPFCFLPSTSVLSVSDLPSPAFRAPAMPEQLGEVLRPVPQVLERRKKRGVPAGGLLAHSRVRGSSFHCGWPYSFFTFQDWPEHTVWLAAQAACVAPCVPALILTLAHCGLVATWTASAAIQGLGRRSGLFRNIPGPRTQQLRPRATRPRLGTNRGSGEG